MTDREPEGKQPRRIALNPHYSVAKRKRQASPLEQTFLHLPRVGLRTERRLWSNGLQTWDDLETKRGYQLSLFGKSQWECWMETIEVSRRALAVGDTDFFAERLPVREHYRIAATFPKETVFLDIETTGLSLYYDKITLIGLSQGSRYVCHIPEAGSGSRVGSQTWRTLLAGSKCMVTFNGTMFDLKFLQRSYPDLAFPRAHVDLRYLARRVALAGGQKAIEKKLGLSRAKDIGDVTGPQAVVLWYEYQTGHRDAGRRLIQYNHADVEGMKAILDEVTERMAVQNTSNPLPRRTDFSKSPSSIRFQRAASAASLSVHIRIPRISRTYRPAAHCDELLASSPNRAFRVVGIDLTGSEKRATGWAYMEGARAETRLIKTDDEILEEIRSVDPDLVSIDSPLSLPQGRLHVRDDDPGRSRFGIMRECERTLKRRGINVYPCLIPSMQGLTARGIRIAERLRSTGIPVIESYPGAAQDIMNIPRKRASLVQLKEGLRLFGVTGDFISKDVSHDEVDAVTSAVVGLFFWSGRYEALGNEQEDYLIVPDLRENGDHGTDREPRRVVGISGPICAGKTTAGRQLERRGYVYARYSEVLEELLGRLNSRTKRSSLQQLGHRIHRESRQRWLNQQLFNRLTSAKTNIVIDGLRWPEDHAFWAERFGSFYCHLHLRASTDVRRQRYVDSRGAAAEFDRVSNHEAESGADSLRTLANYVLGNEGTPTSLARRVSRAVHRYFMESPRCPLP